MVGTDQVSLENVSSIFRFVGFWLPTLLQEEHFMFSNVVESQLYTRVSVPSNLILTHAHA